MLTFVYDDDKSSANDMYIAIGLVQLSLSAVLKTNMCIALLTTKNYLNGFSGYHKETDPDKSKTRFATKYFKLTIMKPT